MMTILDLLKKLYLIRDIIQGCYDTQSNVFSYIQSYEHLESILAFSTNFRSLITRISTFDKDANNRLTTRFALYLEALTELTQGNLKPMLLYLEKHEDVRRFLCNCWHVLEKLYYDFKSQNGDIILLEEYSLLLNENYRVLRVEVLQNNTKMNAEPFNKEFLYGFFRKPNGNKDPFLGNNQQEHERFMEIMNSFFTSFHI